MPEVPDPAIKAGPFKAQLPSLGIGFAIAVGVWLLFYWSFPTKPLTEIEFLAVWVVAYGGVAAVRWLFARLRRREAGDG